MTRAAGHSGRLDAAAVGRALESGHARTLDFEGLQYVRFVDDSRDASRGTVVVGDRVIPTYPHIGRIFALERGVQSHFEGPLQAEEKIDGYNVRIAQVDGTPLAWTRGGYVCPFTTDRLPELADLEPLFREHPDLVVCAEVAGPENPYLHGQVPQVEQDVALFVFDLMRCGPSGFVPVEQRDGLLQQFGIPRSQRLGRFEPGDIEGLRRVVLDLDARGSEGMVLKPLGEGRRVKYVTPQVNLADIVEDASLLAELPGEFFSSRIVRLAIGLQELGLEERSHEMAQRLGTALLEDFEQALHRFHRRGAVSQLFRIRMRSPARAAALFEHLKRASSRVNVREVERWWDGQHYRITLEKIFQQSTGWLRTVLEGVSVVD
jgi:putative ATP-dependent DNA ligase